jgi:hypothetical protein
MAMLNCNVLYSLVMSAEFYDRKTTRWESSEALLATKTPEPRHGDKLHGREIAVRKIGVCIEGMMDSIMKKGWVSPMMILSDTSIWEGYDWSIMKNVGCHEFLAIWLLQCYPTGARFSLPARDAPFRAACVVRSSQREHGKTWKDPTSDANKGRTMWFLKRKYGQWECQDPKMEVLYHIRPYFVGIFIYMVGTSNLGSWNGHWYGGLISKNGNDTRNQQVRSVLFHAAMEHWCFWGETHL